MATKHNVFFRQGRRLVSALILSLGVTAVAQAGDWELRAGVGGGNCESTAGTVELRRVFSPLYDGGALELLPLVEASATLWHHDADDTIWGGGASAGLQLVFRRDGDWRPYISGTVGVFLLSDDEFGTHDLGGNVQFRSRGAVGVQFGADYRHSVQLDAAHFSNAGMYDGNSGFNVFGMSYGFRF